MTEYTQDDGMLEKQPLLPQKEKDGKRVFKLQNWMSTIPSNIPISALSIPGTHDSAAYTSTWPFISTQNLDIHSQLYAGVRYFDFRCGAINEEIEMVHGSATLGLKLSDVLQTMYTWLHEHPSEGLIVQIKQDRESEKSALPFSDLIISTLASNAQYWRTACNTPTLGELRGKIQLLRRFTRDRLYSYGINVTRWQDNPPAPFTIHTYYGVLITIQDHYTSTSSETLPSIVARKGGDVAEMLNRAVQDPDPWHWYINFTSAFEFNVYHQINPRQIALGGYWLWRWVEGINLRLFGSLREMGKSRRRRLGVVVMDFPELPEERLIQSVVDSNFEKPVTRRSKTWAWVMLVALVVVAMLLIDLLLVLVSMDDAEFAVMESHAWQLASRLMPGTWTTTRPKPQS